MPWNQIHGHNQSLRGRFFHLFAHIMPPLLCVLLLSQHRLECIGECRPDISSRLTFYDPLNSCTIVFPRWPRCQHDTHVQRTIIPFLPKSISFPARRISRTAFGIGTSPYIPSASSDKPIIPVQN